MGAAHPRPTGINSGFACGPGRSVANNRRVELQLRFSF